MLGWLSSTDPLSEAPVQDKARLLLLDTLGCITAALGKPEVAQLAGAMAAVDPGPCRLPGMPIGLGPQSAALVGATAACWDEACEGLARAHGRPGVPVIAVGLALAQARGGSLGDLLRALVTGYEVGGRLGAAMRIRAGMHVDATWPAFGAAAAAARLLGLGIGGVVDAVRIAACQMPASLYLPVQQGSTARNTYLGHAAALGLQSAVAAGGGISAPAGALGEARRVVLHATGPLPPLAPVGEWLVLEGYLKPFAAVRHVHYGAAAALALRPEIPEPAAVESARLEVYREAVTYCGNRAPTAPIQAQFSLSWGIAAALVLGDLGPEAYTVAALADPRLRRLERCVEIEVDEARTAGGRRGARLTLTTRNGRHTAANDRVAGDPGLAMSRADVEAKFRRYAAAVLGAGEAARLAGHVLDAPLTAGPWP